MNTTFNFSRFLKVLSNEWRLNLKKMLLFWGGMIVITVIYFAFYRYGKEDIILKNNTFTLAFFLMCIFQGFYLQIYFREFSSKTKTQALLLLPASRNETFWAKFLLGVILYLLIFSAYLFIVIRWNGMHNDWIMELEKYSLDDWKYKYFQNYQMLLINRWAKLILFLFWIFSISAYLFGNMTFKKWAVFKSLVFWFIVVMGLILVTYSIYALFTGTWPSSAIPGIVITYDKYYAGCFIFQIYPELLYGLGILICLALIVISRIKYNEKTI